MNKKQNHHMPHAEKPIAGGQTEATKTDAEAHAKKSIRLPYHAPRGGKKLLDTTHAPHQNGETGAKPLPPTHKRKGEKRAAPEQPAGQKSVAVKSTPKLTKEHAPESRTAHNAEKKRRTKGSVQNEVHTPKTDKNTEKTAPVRREKGKSSLRVGKKQTGAKLRIMSLGGLMEIGKNMTVIEYGRDIIVVDSGFAFPDEDMLGVDYVIPDITYLEQNADRVRGIFCPRRIASL